MYIPCQIKHIRIAALGDTGASGLSFVSESLVQELSLPQKPLTQPINLRNFQNAEAYTLHHYCHLPLRISQHVEDLIAYIIPDAKYDLVLGLPWFEKHNPFVDWSSRSLTFGEPCLSAQHNQVETTVNYFNTPKQATHGNFAPLLSPPSAPEPWPLPVSGIHYPAAPLDPEKTQSATPSVPAPVNVNTPVLPEVSLRAVQLSAPAFHLACRGTHAQTFTLSLREIDTILDDNNRREVTVRVGDAIMVVPKDANPKEFVPPEYHDLLQAFDRKIAETLPPHRSQDHAIDLLPGKVPPAARPYSMNDRELRALRDQLDKDLARGFIRMSRSSAAAPILFVKKANGDLRFCCDYRGLNEVTKKNRHALPLIQETLNQLSQARYFTKLDIISAFNQLRIKEGDEWKTAFTTRYGLFEYLVMPFGLCNGPSSFQAYINSALHGILDRYCTAYMDDVLIYSKTKSEHRAHVREVLKRLIAAGLPIDVSKCEFDAQEVKYLGLIVSTKGISMDPAKVACIQDWPQPRHVKDVQGFLGFANFYRRFIPEFSRLATPLTALTKKDALFAWNDACASAFLRIKSAFQEGQMLAHFDPSRKTILETDASDFVTAAILSQYNENDILRPVAFMSKKMIPAECNYEIYDKELLAIVKAFETWTAELGSVSATVLTDHRNLEYFTTTKKLNRRQARWNELLADFDFKIVFRPGKQNGKADALTRIHADAPQNNLDARERHQHQVLLKPHQILRPIETVLSSEPIKDDLAHETPDLTPEGWKIACSSDSYCNEIRSCLESREKSRSDIQLASCSPSEFSFMYNEKEYVPESLRVRIMSQLHETPAFGHRGAAALFALVSRRFWWPDCHKDTAKFAHGCESCQRNNPSTQRPYGFLHPLPAPEHAFRHLTLDFVGPLEPCAIRGHTYRNILQVVDRLTKRVWIIPTETMTARETASAFVNNVFRFCGLPDSLVSDQGKAFIDATWKFLCRTLNIRHKLSTSHHPQTDGQTERSNRTMEVYLRHFVSYHQNDWAPLLPIAEFCINNHANASTGVSPFFASFGHHPRLDFRPESNDSTHRNPSEFAKHIEDVQRHCHEAITLAQAYQETYANRKRLPAPRYQEGDLVYLSLKNIKSARPTAKLDHLRAGPWKITKMKTPLVAKLDLPLSLSRIDNNFHVSLLRPAAIGFPEQQKSQPPPVFLADDEEPSYEVEEILDSRLRYGKQQYLVRWSGYEDPTWEPIRNLDNCEDLLSDYEARRSSRLEEEEGIVRIPH